MDSRMAADSRGFFVALCQAASPPNEIEDAELGKNTPCGLVAESVGTFHCRPSVFVGTEELESFAPLIGTEERYWPGT